MSKRKYQYGEVAIMQPKYVTKSYVSLAKSKKRGYYTTARQRAAGAFGRPGLLGFRPSNTEVKFFDTDLAFNCDATLEVPVTGQLSLIPQGDTQSTRDGYKCVIRSIYIHAQARLIPAAAANASGTVCIWLIQDTQCNGAAATAADANTGVFTNADYRLANVTIANGGRFIIHKKWTIDFNSSAGVTTAYNNHSHSFEFFKKCNIPMRFDASAATGAITTIRSNNLFLVAGADTLLDDLVSVNGSCRLRFTDH